MVNSYRLSAWCLLWLVLIVAQALMAQEPATVRLEQWSVDHPDRAYWRRAGDAAVADGKASQWSMLISPQTEFRDIELRFDLTLERPARPSSAAPDHYDFRNCHAGRENDGFDVAAVLRHGGPEDLYRIQFSSRFGELAIWKPSGGIVCAVPFRIEVGKTYRMAVAAIGKAIRVAVDGKDVLRYRDEVLPVESGALGLAVYDAKARYENVKIGAPSPPAAPTGAAAHKFSLREFIGGQWIFDGAEPIALLDKRQLILWAAKLKPGFRPVLYWELFWKQYDGKHNYSDTPIEIKVLEQGGPMFRLSWRSRDPADRVTTSAEMALTYDESYHTYSYDVMTALTVNPGKTWRNQADGIEYCNLIPYNVVGPATFGQRVEWPWWYRWVGYQDADGKRFRYPLNHNYNTRVYPKPNGGFYGFFGDNVVNPVVLFDNPTDAGLKPYSGICHWAYDIHFRYLPYEFGYEIPSDTKLTAHYRIVGFDQNRSGAALAGADVTPYFLDKPRFPIYVRRKNDFRFSRSPAEPHKEYEWAGGTWDTTVGMGDRYSLRLDGGVKGKDSSNVRVGSSNFSDAITDGIYILTAYVKMEGVEGKGPAISLQPLYPDEPPILQSAGTRNDGKWYRVRLVKCLPSRAAIAILLEHKGKGKVWFDDVEMEYPDPHDPLLYEAESLARSPDNTQVVDDTTATHGKALLCRPKKGANDTFFYGPYAPATPAGEYEAFFRAKVARNDTDISLVEFDVYDTDAAGVIAKKLVKASDFRSPNVYQYFAIPFRCSGVGRMQYRARGLADQELWVDHVAVMPQRELWAEDYSPPAAVLDQAQFLQSGYCAREKLGQTFAPTGKRIERIDLMMKNRTGTDPGVLRLWKWQGSYDKTVAAQPLFTDIVDLSGPDYPQMRHWQPKLDVEPGATYFVETEKQGQCAGIIYVDEDIYPAGSLYVNGVAIPAQDAFFLVYSSDAKPAPTAQQAPATPVLPMTLSSCLPPGESRPITKADYLDIVRKYADANSSQWQQADGNHAHSRAFLSAFLFKATGDEEHVRDALDQFRKSAKWRQDHPGMHVGFPWLAPACLAYEWVRSSPLVSEADHKLIRDLVMDSAEKHWPIRERGSMNRSMGSALGYSLMAKLFPDAPNAKAWRDYAALVWNDWFEFRDTEEDSLHYHALWWDYVITYADENGIDIYKDPGVRKLITRYRDQVSPLGPMPPYGDCYGWGFEWGGYVLLFERAATAYRDGTFKWAAHRILDYHLRHIKNAEPWLATYEDIPHLALAYLHADDSVKPEPIPGNSALLTRKSMEFLSVEERKKESLFAKLKAEDIPDKLILRSQAGAGGLFACFNLIPRAGHGHLDAPALISLTNDGTVLLTDTCYEDRLAEEHSQTIVNRIRGGKLIAEPPTRAFVEHFSEHNDATFAQVRVADYVGWGAQRTRQILFVKNALIMVRDVVEFAQEMEASTGALWRVCDLLPERGDNWFDACWAEPRGFRWKWKNGDDRLLFWFAPQQGAEVNYKLDLWRVTRDEIRWSPPWCLYQKFGRLPVHKSDRVHFTSLIVPHKADVAPEKLAEAVKTIHDSANATAIEIALPNRSLLLFIGDGTPVTAGPLKTDARFLLLDRATHRITAAECCVISIDGREIVRSERKENVDRLMQ